MALHQEAPHAQPRLSTAGTVARLTLIVGSKTHAKPLPKEQYPAPGLQ